VRVLPRLALLLVSLVALAGALSGCAGTGSEEEQESSAAGVSQARAALVGLREHASESELSFVREHRSELEEEARQAGFGEVLDRVKAEVEGEEGGEGAESEGEEVEYGEEGPLTSEAEGEGEGEEEVEYGEDGEPVAPQES
jgi:hypothetical protein